ncbi:LysR family transcriptional regulator [Reyranella sp.]|uniref:LysR family transcriptional regulator n=1 Tax=Reyranella sp. TaxID=1929291 RepID=UPI001207D30C|nr:LysR family transcriptional regulator [Reyranella sp.]TAJ87645.1 MAG: LysR family transcriptional regulator [Reyranella sp.]
MNANASALRNRLIARARIRHLQVLVQIAELGSVKRTAEAIGLTQPAVTHVLADLETLLECKLFLRHARGMRPTPIGAALLAPARRILATVETGAEQVVAMTGRASGTVRIAAISAGISGVLVKALPQFSRRHPEILIQAREADAVRLAALIERDEVDIALCRAPSVTPQGWRFVPLVEDRFAVVAGPGHPLLKRRKVGMDELRKAKWLIAPVPMAARQAFDRLFADETTPPRTSSIVTNVPALFWSMLTREQLLCVLPVSFVKQLADARQVFEVSLAQELPFDPIGMLLRTTDAGEAVRKLAGFLEATAARD